MIRIYSELLFGSTHTMTSRGRPLLDYFLRQHKRQTPTYPTVERVLGRPARVHLVAMVPETVYRSPAGAVWRDAKPKVVLEDFDH